MTQRTSAPQSDHTVCRNPATGEILGYSPLTPVEDLKQIMENARKAQKTWVSLPIGNRVKYVRRVRNYIVENADEIAEVISRALP